jgi:hypothetical protein
VNTPQVPPQPIPPLPSYRPASSPHLPAYSPPAPMAPSPPLPLSSIGQSPDPMFDSIAHTQAGLPHLLSYLQQQYRQYVRRVNQEQNLQINPELAISSARTLLDFCEQFLTIHRPVQVFPVDMNYGVVLDNNDRVAICPGVADIRGTMQDSGAVSISSGRSQPGQAGQAGVVPMSGTPSYY